MTEEEKRVPVTTYPKEGLLVWIDAQAAKDGRSRTKQIEFILEEARKNKREG